MKLDDLEDQAIRSVILFSLILIICCPSYAADKPKGERKVDPAHREEVLKRLFLDSVITSQTYLDRLLNPDEIPVTKSSYPWIYPHLVPENGLPKPLSVNKWAQPITIAFGMPNDLKPFDEDSKASFRFTDFEIVNSLPTVTPFSRPIATPLGAQVWAYPRSA